MTALTAARRWFADCQIEPLGDGHIHDTFVVRAANGQYVLQGINQTVFQDAQLLTQQLKEVLSRWSLQSEYLVPEQVESLGGKLLETSEDQAWRVWRFVENSRVIDPLANTQQAEAAGRAFGSFQHQLAGMTPAPQAMIPGFLQLAHYLQEYRGVAAQAPPAWDALIQSNIALAEQLAARNAIIHGDCKVNNLLFDVAGERVVAVIDFDTVMAGHWAWDFGDLVRSICFSMGELDEAYFRAALRGFAQQQTLVNAEDCVAAPQYLALMLGVRFLTDHLQGDRYFRVTQPGDNLQRAEQQFELFQALQVRARRWRAVAAEVLEELR